MTADLKPARARRADECLFCSSRTCHVRIHTPDGLYDEVACRDHQRDLEQHADRHLGRMLRTSTSSSSPQRREHARRWVIFLVDALATGRPIRMVGRCKRATELLRQAMTFETERDARCYVVNDLGEQWEYRAIVGRMD